MYQQLITAVSCHTIIIKHIYRAGFRRMPQMH